MIELTPGQEMVLTADDGAPLGRVQLRVGWARSRTAGFMGTGAPHVDLDATAVQFADGTLFDLAFYNNLTTRDGSVVHHGDNLTGEGDGDDEVVTVDLDRVYAKVDTILLMVSSYQGHSLEWVSRASCRLVADDDVELARVTLFGGVPDTGIVLATLVRDGDRWTLHAIGRGIAATVPTESLEALRTFL